jgi:septal ring factor EnvC (AmiA/AmiB activator)
VGVTFSGVRFRWVIYALIIGLVLGGGLAAWIILHHDGGRISGINDQLRNAQNQSANLADQLRAERINAQAIRTELDRLSDENKRLIAENNRLGKQLDSIRTGIIDAQGRTGDIAEILQGIRRRGKFKIMESKD